MTFCESNMFAGEDKGLGYAEEVYSISTREDGKALSLLCPTKKTFDKSNSLNIATLTIDIGAPFDGAISIETTHWLGALNPGPHFDLYPADKPPTSDVNILSSDILTTISSGSISATIKTDSSNFDIRFYATDGSKQLTSLLNRSVGFASVPSPRNPVQTGHIRNLQHSIFTQTGLSVGESIYGLGERSGAFNKVGHSITLWNADGGISRGQAYNNIPFWISSRGYGIFIDTPDKIELEIGSGRCSRVRTTVEGQRLKWYILHGPSPKEILQKYCILTGQPGNIPSWSFGPGLSTGSTADYDEVTVKSLVEGMKSRDISVGTFHFDSFWMKPFHWCDFVFDIEKFPDPKAQIAHLKSSVDKVCVSINPYLSQASPVFKLAASRGYLLRRKNGDIFQTDHWQTGIGIVDFTNPEAVEWYVSCLQELFDSGVDAIKTDFGQYIPTEDVEWFNAPLNPKKMRNYYAFLYTKIVYEALQDQFGENEAVLFARAASAGTQRFPVHCGSDCEPTPEGMAESIRGGLSLGLCGYSFWSVDIGGSISAGSPPPWLYKRWLAFGLLCSHSRLHGKTSSPVPWMIDGDDESAQGCSKILSKWTALRARLMPYLFSQAQESVTAGLPLSLRAMLLEFPDDPTCWYLDRQFMLGESILIAPVFEESGEVEFYLPAGRWTNFFTNKVKEGPGWFKEQHEFDTLPMYVRENTILVLGKWGERRTVYDYSKSVEVCLYHTRPGTKSTLFGCEGEVAGILEVGDDEHLVDQEFLQELSILVK
ncbi:hypothetical protein G7Y89_g6379 [Cudoniella acicularis]|uniref:Glycoside hydrolase family 31 N-terminal domain-containing protein n=1 Tax=Cudoniella acicularis TaxID=354080 RepID=A0A8H4W2H5_9HELO|nr:hypothetical protein G7Y89_g6379 [Cudoniella acicularis]